MFMSWVKPTLFLQPWWIQACRPLWGFSHWMQPKWQFWIIIFLLHIWFRCVEGEILPSLSPWFWSRHGTSAFCPLTDRSPATLRCQQSAVSRCKSDREHACVCLCEKAHSLPAVDLWLTSNGTFGYIHQNLFWFQSLTFVTLGWSLWMGRNILILPTK